MGEFDEHGGVASGGPKPFIDRQAQPTRAALVCPDLRGNSSFHGIEAREAEFVGLAGAIGLNVVFSDVLKLREIRPATYLGAGQVATLADKAKSEEIELLLVDAALSPIQQRNLERETGTKVLDRTALILEIFGERAATREGVLQVELAHLNYQKGRLVRSWTHLERQRGSGGMGFMGGPGETQIESDRRQIGERIALLEDRLEKVKRTREQQRRQRTRAQIPIVALVGYTNAGKSSLFNRLTGAGVFAKDLLFATLDTTVRKITLPHGREVMLSDTVGFVADLPHDLVAAFRATLEEVTEADIILHVRDIANADHAAQAQDVLTVLDELGVSAENTAIVEVWNKVDLLEDPVLALASAKPAGAVVTSVPLSAQTGQGVDHLLEVIEKTLGEQSRTYQVHVPHSAGADIGWLHSHAEVVLRGEPDERGTSFVVRVDPRHRAMFLERFNGRIEADGS
ncbi:MAG: GTPase HflX [Devosia sp.]|uniref:GTPase HflX n=1 Tax=Devosia sp. TaxID=1871048 RepID=UPI0024CC2245|nr:GTPase HflX [Devosia sp.]UYO00344.1 MAG: GTPase HflX [Devosia sp.]